jgi:hypothetical protein
MISTCTCILGDNLSVAGMLLSVLFYWRQNEKEKRCLQAPCVANGPGRSVYISRSFVFGK